MALSTVYIDKDLGVLKYFGNHFEVVETQGTGRMRRDVRVGYRYQLVSFSCIGKEIIVNVANPQVLTLPMGATVELVNPIVRPKGVRIGQNQVIEAVEIWADNLVAVG